MIEQSEPEITINAIKARIRAGAMAAAARRGAKDAALAFNSDSSSGQEPPTFSLQPPFQTRSDDRYHVNDLVKYHDRNFIQNAYLAILKRGPDATGFTNFIGSLRQGRLNKIDILARLRYSSEGRAKKVEVKGLLFPAIVRQAYHIPLLGYVLNLAVGFARLPAMIRHGQQLEAHLIAQQEQIVDYANRINTDLFKRTGDLLASLARLTEEIEASAQQQQRQLDLFAQRQSVAQHEMHDHFIKATQQLEIRFDEESVKRQEHIERLAQSLRQEVERTFQKQQEVRAELALQGGRVMRLLEEAQNRLPAPFSQPQLEAIAGEQAHALDAFYVAFEDRFRGSRAEIKERLKVYVPRLTEAGIGSNEMPVLDAACGRGEWLELLREENLRARGVDLNRALVAGCRARGLDVAEADVMDFLRALPAESFGAVTGFHIVEHLLVETLIRFLDETLRVIKPGGMVIFETPNPQNVLVGSCNFYFDPTHRNPLPSPVLKFMLESRGFHPVEIVNLNPSDAEPVTGDTDLVKRFNEYFYGPMDYGVVGRKL